MMSQHRIISGIAKPASMAANGPTRPTIPNPEDCGVPLMENSATGTAEMIAVNKHGTKIIGYLNRFGIMSFMAPKAIANVTPDLFTVHEYTTSAKAVAATPSPLHQLKRHSAGWPIRWQQLKLG